MASDEHFTPRSVAVGETALLLDDDRVPEGGHWRVTLPSNALPAGPAIMQHALTGTTEINVRIGGQVGGVFPEVSPDRPLHITIENLEPDDVMVAWVHVQADGDLRVAVIDNDHAAPNGAYQEIVARTSDPYALAAADLSMVRVTGTGRVIEVSVFGCRRDLGDRLGGAPIVDVTSIAQELADVVDVYQSAGIIGERWQDRAERSAPRRAVPYHPTHPDDPVAASAEIDRIETFVAAGVTEWGQRAYASLRDPGADVLRHAAAPDASGVAQAEVTYSSIAALHTACTDPGIARWLGLSGTMRDIAKVDEPTMFVALLPVYRIADIADGVIGFASDGTPSGISNHYDALADDAFTRAVTVVREINKTRAPFAPRRCTVQMLAVAVPATIVGPDGPLAPIAAPAGSVWRTEFTRPWLWDAPVAMTGSVPTGRVSLVSTAPEWRSLHSLTGDEPNSLLAGWPSKGLTVREPVVTVMGVEEGIESMDVEVRLGDWVGRWSGPGVTTVGQPERPAPVPPHISGILRRGAPAGGTAPASPGEIEVRLRVPGLSAVGARRVTGIRLSDGVVETIALSAAEGVDGTVRTTSFAAPETIPGESRSVVVTARTVDASGQTSSAVGCTVPVSDPRAVRAPTIAPRLLVTSRRTNDPDVTIAVQVRPPGGVGGVVSYRFLIAAEATLRVHAGVAGLDVGLPRAERAAILVANSGRREHYSWALEGLVAPDADGIVRATIRLPSGTSEVMLLKAMPMVGPVTPGGEPQEAVSTPFASIPAAAIVVPDDDPPPAPRLSAEVVDDDLSVVVVVSGLDPAVLRRLSGPPEVQLLEVVDAQSDPRFWPVVAAATMSATDVPGAFEATVIVDDAPAWTTVGLAARVRYPAEATVMSGAAPVPNPELTAAGVQPEFIESRWGPTSAPLWVEIAGSEPTVRDISTAAQISFAVDDLVTLVAGQPTWQATVLSGTAALIPTSPPRAVTVDDAVVVVADPADGVTAHAVQLVDPFGIPRRPIRLGV